MIVRHGQGDIFGWSVFAEYVEDLIREGWSQDGLGEMVEGFFEAETVEEPDAVDEDFVFGGQFGSVCGMRWDLRGRAIFGEEVFDKVIEYRAFVVVWGFDACYLVMEGAEVGVCWWRIASVGLNGCIFSPVAYQVVK